MSIACFDAETVETFPVVFKGERPQQHIGRPGRNGAFKSDKKFAVFYFGLMLPENGTEGIVTDSPVGKTPLGKIRRLLFDNSIFPFRQQIEGIAENDSGKEKNCQCQKNYLQ